MSRVSRAFRYVVFAMALGLVIGVVQQGSVVSGLAIGVLIAVGVLFGLVIFEFASRIS